MSQIDIKDASNMEDISSNSEIKKLFSDMCDSLDFASCFNNDAGLEGLIDEYCKDRWGKNESDILGYAFPWLKNKSEPDKNTSTQQHQETPHTNINNNINRRHPKSNNRFNNYSKSNKANKDSSNKETHNSPYINLFPGYTGTNQKKTQVHGGVETAKKCCCNDNKSTAKPNAKVSSDNDMLKQILHEIINLRTSFVATMGTLKTDIINDVKKLIVEHDNRLIAKLKHDLAGKDKEIAELNEKLKDYNEMTNLMQSFFGKTPSELSSK